MNNRISVPRQETAQRYPEELVVPPLPAHPKQLDAAFIALKEEKSSTPQSTTPNHEQQPTAANQTKPKQQLHNKKDENRPYYGALVHKARSQNLSEPTPFKAFVYEPEITDSHI
jgi:hypothetical protein